MRDGILIGEGVILDARPASFVTRTLGALIDLGVLAAAIILLSVVGALTLDSVTADYAVPVVITFVVTITVVVPTTVETMTRGRSLGKLALGIRVVRDDGGPIRFRHSLVRALIGLFELWLTFGSVALIASLTNDKGKRLGDMAAGTYAIRVRGGRPTLGVVSMPPALRTWAAHADMRRLPDGLALAARQFLARASRLNPGSRARLGQELAATMERYVAPGPPPATHPEAFLMAVLAERRDRDRLTAQRAQELAAHQAQMLHRLPYSVPDPRS